MYSDPNLIKEITNKRKYILDKSTNVYSVIEDLFNGSLDREALQHSLRLENPLVDVLEEVNPVKQEELKEEIKKNGDYLKKAWEYGMKNFKMPLKNSFLLYLAKKIDPELFPGEKANHRTMSVRPKGAFNTPPYPAKIDYAMNKFFTQMKEILSHCNKKKKPEEYFDIGSWLHLHLVRIHPFEDANGRVSRMIHNLYLKKASAYPPIIIKEGERQDYYGHLDDAMTGYRHRGEGLVFTREELSKKERDFYDYMAGKLNVSLDAIIEKKLA